MIAATLLTWALLGQSGGGFAGPSGIGTPLANPFLDHSVAADRPRVTFIPQFVEPRRGEPALPGSRLDAIDALRQAHTVVAGRVTRMSPLAVMGFVHDGDCEVILDECWKGPAPRDPQRRFGLRRTGAEAWPKVGANYLFFLARQGDADVVIKVLPPGWPNVGAVRGRVADEAPPDAAGPAGPDADLPGADLPLDAAAARARAIVVGRVAGYPGLRAARPALLGEVDFVTTATLKGPAGLGDRRGVPLIARGGESLPVVGREYAFFLAGQPGADAVIKALPATPATVAAIERAVAALPAPAPTPVEAVPPTRQPDLANAADLAAVAFVGRALEVVDEPRGPALTVSKVAFRPLEMLRGRARDVEMAGLQAITVAINRREVPEAGADYVVFASRLCGFDSLYKFLPATPANIESARQALRAADARTLPSNRVPGVAPHAVVVAEVAAGALVDAGGVGLGWCELRSPTSIRGDAALAGRRLGYTTYRGKLAPAVGGWYLFEVGTVDGRDAILSVGPATIGAIRAAEQRWATPGDEARRLLGADLPLADATARAHAVYVATVEGGMEVGAGGLAMASVYLRVTAALKGAPRPGDRLGLGFSPPDGESRPRPGESLLVFVGKAEGRDIDVPLKFLPATPAHIEAARDQIMTVAPPVAAR